MSAPAPSRNAGWWIAIAASIVVLAAVIAAIAVMGSPSRQRLMRLDERRVDDLGRIEVAIDAYHNEHGHAPATLAALGAEPGVRVPRDPESLQAYGYEVIGKAEYRLCAQFDTDMAASPEPQPWLRAAWVHGKGRQCFKRRSDAVRE